MRVPVDTIAAPLFPTSLPRVNARAPLATIQRGTPMLVEFWDFCRPNSIRTLPYMRAWHERYEPLGLRVIGVHCPGFEPSRDEQAVRDAVERLQITYPVVIDSEPGALAGLREPGMARPLPVRRPRAGCSSSTTARAPTRRPSSPSRSCSACRWRPLAPVRPEDAPDAILTPQTQDQPGPYCGPYEAGGVWGVFDGPGTVSVNGAEVRVEHPGAYSC